MSLQLSGTMVWSDQVFLCLWSWANNFPRPLDIPQGAETCTEFSWVQHTLLRLINLSWSWEQKIWSAGPVSPGTCAKIVEAPEVNYCGAKLSLARAVNLSSKLHKSSYSCSWWRAAHWSQSAISMSRSPGHELFFCVSWIIHDIYVCYEWSFRCTFRLGWSLFERIYGMFGAAN